MNVRIAGRAGRALLWCGVALATAVGGAACAPDDECYSNFDCYAGQTCEEGLCVAQSLDDDAVVLGGGGGVVDGNSEAILDAAFDGGFVGNIGVAAIDNDVVFDAWRYGNAATISFTRRDGPTTFFRLNIEHISLLSTPGQSEITGENADGSFNGSFGQACNYDSTAEGYDEIVDVVTVTVDDADEDGVYDVELGVDGVGSDGVGHFSFDPRLL